MEPPSPSSTIGFASFVPDEYEEGPIKCHVELSHAQRVRAVAKEQGSRSNSSSGSSAFSLKNPFVPDLLGEIIDFEEKAAIGRIEKTKQNAQQPLVVADRNSSTSLPQLPPKTEIPANKHGNPENHEPEGGTSTQKRPTESFASTTITVSGRGTATAALLRPPINSIPPRSSETTTRRHAAMRNYLSVCRNSPTGAQRTPSESSPACVRATSPARRKNVKIATNFERNLMQTILKSSHAHTWPEARREWRGSTTQCGRPQTASRCCCDRMIRNVFTMTNEVTKCNLHFGSRCVKIFE